MIRYQPHISHRTPPHKFFSRFFGECILQAAIDFAGMRMRNSGVRGVEGVERNAARSSASPNLHLSLTFSCGHIAAHHANFLAGAICLILRSCGCGVVERNKWWGWALGTNPASHIATHHAAFSASAFCKCKLQLILRGCEAKRSWRRGKWWSGMPHVLRRGRLCT